MAALVQHAARVIEADPDLLPGLVQAPGAGARIVAQLPALGGLAAIIDTVCTQGTVGDGTDIAFSWIRPAARGAVHRFADTGKATAVHGHAGHQLLARHAGTFKVLHRALQAFIARPLAPQGRVMTGIGRPGTVVVVAHHEDQIQRLGGLLEVDALNDGAGRIDGGGHQVAAAGLAAQQLDGGAQIVHQVGIALAVTLAAELHAIDLAVVARVLPVDVHTIEARMLAQEAHHVRGEGLAPGGVASKMEEAVRAAPATNRGQHLQLGQALLELEETGVKAPLGLAIAQRELGPASTELFVLGQLARATDAQKGIEHVAQAAGLDPVQQADVFPAGHIGADDGRIGLRLERKRFAAESRRRSKQRTAQAKGKGTAERQYRGSRQAHEDSVSQATRRLTPICYQSDTNLKLLRRRADAHLQLAAELRLGVAAAVDARR